MSGPLKIILNERDEEDALRIERTLRRSGFAPVISRVRDAGSLNQALDQDQWDVMLSEWDMPGLGVGQILGVLGGRGLDLPIIVVTGVKSEDAAVKAMQTGVRDFVCKEHLARLVPVIQRELKEAKFRRQRRQAEAALRETEDRYRTMLEASPDSIVVYDMKGRATYLNHSFCKTFGWSAGELLGKRIPYVPDAAEETTRQAVQRSLKGEQVQYFETKRLTKDGRVLDVQLSSALFHNRDGRAAGNIVILRDLSGQKEQEAERTAIQAQLRQSQKMEAIGTLAGGIAHDFNNILGVITGYTELALSKMKSGGQPKDEVCEVLVACLRAKQLIMQILAFSRSNQEERRPMRVSTIAKEVVKLLRASLPTFIEIREDITTDGAIMGDPIEIHQLIMNLATNAGQAMRSQDGVLKISLRRADPALLTQPAFSQLEPGDYLELAISDTGPGIDPRILDRIFEPFFTTKDQGEGTGMGLAVVHGIVKGHRGGIKVESAPGRGASFSILLPEVNSGQQAAEDVQIPQTAPHGSGRILFVDDEEDLANIGKRHLESLGYQVTALSSPSRALELFLNKPENFDLVITDQTMPGLTGVQLAQKIMDAQPGTPVVLCTGYSELITAEQAKAQGITQFVMKPFAKSELAQAVSDALAGR